MLGKKLTQLTAPPPSHLPIIFPMLDPYIKRGKLVQLWVDKDICLNYGNVTTQPKEVQ